MESPVVEYLVLRTAVIFLLLGGLVAAYHWMKSRLGVGGSTLWESLVKPLRPRVLSMLAAALGLVGLSALVALSEPDPQYFSVISKGFAIAWVLLGAWALTIACSILNRAVEWKFDVTVEDNLGARQIHTKTRVLQRILVVLIWLGAIAAVLMQFERFRMLGTTLLASAGILSIVLGLSAQKTFGSIIAGIQIALSHPINIDDVVVIEGEWGRIEDITFTYVVVRIWDLRRLVVPISYFLETPFQNWTKKSADILGAVTLHVDYATPLAPLREELKRLCEGAPELWDGKTCVMQVTEAGPETMTLRALVSTANASKGWDLRCLVREGLIDFLQANYPGSLPRRRLEITSSGD